MGANPPVPRGHRRHDLPQLPWSSAAMRASIDKGKKVTAVKHLDCWAFGNFRRHATRNETGGAPSGNCLAFPLTIQPPEPKF